MSKAAELAKLIGDGTFGIGGAEDKKIVFDGNAQDFHIGLDDSADKLTVGVGSTLGTNTALTVNSSGHVSGQTKYASASPIDLTSNTSGYTFSSIPSVYDRLTMTIKAWSVASTANLQIQLGASGGLVTSGYQNHFHYFTASSNIQTDESHSPHTCFSPTTWNGAQNSMYVIVSLFHHGDNTWFLRGSFLDTANMGFTHIWNGWVDVGGTLTQIKLFPSASSIDAGTVSLMYG